MFFSLFMGIVLAHIMSAYGFSTAILVAFVVAMFHRSKSRTKILLVPNQERILAQIARLKIEKVSDKVLGEFQGYPIHEYIIAKNPGETEFKTYFYDDIIQYDDYGQITRSPKTDEVYTLTGLIYKLRPNT